MTSVAPQQAGAARARSGRRGLGDPGRVWVGGVLGPKQEEPAWRGRERPSGAWHLYSDGLRLGVGDCQAPHTGLPGWEREESEPLLAGAGSPILIWLELGLS